MTQAAIRPGDRSVLEDWWLDSQVVHLNHGSFGAVRRSTTAHQQHLREEVERDPDAWFRELPVRVAEARRAIARLLDAPEHATALVTNASAGVSAVLNSISVPAGSQVVVTDHAYGAVEMAVRRFAARHEAEVCTVHIPLDADAAQTAEMICAALGDRTTLVVLDQITSATARVMPVRETAAHCRERGIPLLVDGAHAPGQVLHPVAGLVGAYWVGNLHKWWCAPRGTAALVADTEDRHLLYPPIDSWGAPDPFPQRFDRQGTQDLTSWLAAPYAVAEIEERYGWSAARAHMSALVTYGQQCVADRWGARLDDLGSDPAPAMRLVPLPAGIATNLDSAHALQRVLAEQGYATAVTSWHGRGFLRLSAHLYNTAADYEGLAERCAHLFA
jgi:isopenicillin-N epimerase